MPVYTKQTWVDGPLGGTPLSAVRLTHIEDGIEAVETALTAGLAAETTARADADALLILLTEKGAANGVAMLGSDGVVPDAQLPAALARDTEVASAVAAEASARSTADALLIPLTQKGAANGVPTLDGSGLIPDAQIPAGIARDSEVTSAVATETTRAQAAEATLIPLAQRAANNGVATLDPSGKVPTSQLPALAISQSFPVANQAAMLALTAERGDVAIRSDLGKSFILATDDPTVLANWLELSAAGKVTSVNGQQGVVSLAAADVGLGNVNNTSDASKPVSTAQQTALDGKAQKLARTAVKTADYTAAAGELVPFDTATPNTDLTLTLPTAPPNGSRIAAKYVAVGVGHIVNVTCGGSDVFNKAGGATTLPLRTLNQGYELEYDSGIWTVVAGDLPLPASSPGWLADDGTGVRVWSTPSAAQVGAPTVGVYNAGTITTAATLPAVAYTAAKLTLTGGSAATITLPNAVVGAVFDLHIFGPASNWTDPTIQAASAQSLTWLGGTPVWITSAGAENVIALECVTAGTWTAVAVTSGLVTSKGDLVVGTGGGAVGRQAVGTNGQVLTADSTTATGTKWADLPAASSTLTTTTQSGTTYTFALADAGTVIEFTNASAVTVTVPPNSSVAFPVGSIFNVYAAGAGGVTIAAGAGVTIRNNAAGILQYGEVSLRKRATDEWVRVG